MVALLSFAFYFTIAAVAVTCLVIAHLRRHDDIVLDPNSALSRLLRRSVTPEPQLPPSPDLHDGSDVEHHKLETHLVSTYLHEAEHPMLATETRVWLEFERPQSEVGARTIKRYVKQRHPQRPPQPYPFIDDIVN